MSKQSSATVNGVEKPDPLSRIIDIRSDAAGINLKHEIRAGLEVKQGEEKTLPTLLLYDNKGLKLFEKITYLDQYYLTGNEIEVLTQHADQMADRIPDEALVVELGSGNLRKVKILLDALDRAQKRVTYFALDLMQSELDRTLADVPEGTFQYVKCAGLLGTYDDGLEWLKRPENVSRPKAILSLGSSIGNFPPNEAAEFLAQFADLFGQDDLMLVGIDGCLDADKVYNAYNDRDGVTHEFTMNGLEHANRLLGYDAFDMNDWTAIGEYDSKGMRHRAFVAPKRDVTVEGVLVRRGEKVRIEESYKYSQERATGVFSNSNVIEIGFWSTMDDAGTHKIHLLKSPTMKFGTKPDEYARHPVPDLAQWGDLWKTWDIVTRQMIAEDELVEKPIKLRNACIFYLGHIPTFLDMKITEATETKPTEPSYFYKIFERGIDPDVDDPAKCHAHSEIPDTWPNLETILKFQEGVRERVRKLYETGQAFNDNWTGRTLWLGFEHEVMHLETLLYMLIQSEKTLPPSNTSKPDFEQLAKQARHDAVENEWFTVPEQTIQIGLNDPDNADGPVRHFGWDVEKPAYITTVKSFKAKGRPITNGEFAKYLDDTGKHDLPASWVSLAASNGVNGVNGVHSNGNTVSAEFLQGKAVRTVFGFVPLKHALDWPVSASYDELLGCAKYMGGRIPTKEEARSIYHYAGTMKMKEASNALGKTIPAVNGHLVNEGVQETPPSKASNTTSSSAAASHVSSDDLFADLEHANVGFKHWHPMPVTQHGNKLCGLAEMGGLWEWTSSALEKVEGFTPMKLYPNYSADFYDDKHNVVLGGSWATHPRVAGRKTFVNWYQRNYPFVWAGARLVKDA